MEIINTVLGVPLGYIIFFAYSLTSSYGLAILIFALIVRVVMFPVSVFAHKNSIRLLRLQPSLDKIKRRYAGDRERLNEEQHELFTKERYSPLVGLIPLFMQLALIIGMLQVMYQPLQHMLRLDRETIDVLTQAARTLYGDVSGFRIQMVVLEAFQHPENIDIFRAALAGFANADIILYTLAGTNMQFLGLNLGAIPSIGNPSIELMVPVLSGIVALAFCQVTVKLSPGALSQGVKTNRGFTIFTVGLSLYFTLVMPVGVGVYWTAGNFFGIVAVLILDRYYNPKKFAGEALEYLDSIRKTPEQLREERRLKKELVLREKQDAARFVAAKKQLVFYALAGGQYKYYKNIIKYILENSEIVIHYLTNDPNDTLFKQHHERLIPYYASQGKTISLMLKLNCDMMVTTVSDLQSYHMKRSIVRDDIEYVVMPHGLASLHMVAREKAFDYYDTVFCVGPHQATELRRREELANLHKKKLVKAGYGVYDQLVEAYATISHIVNEKPQILIAPSWHMDNIMDICINDILETLFGNGYHIIVRPHPQYLQLFSERIYALREHYSVQISSGELAFELDFSDNKSIFLSDMVITDWSNIAYEFSYSTLKPSIFINTPMKVMNPNYKQFGLEIMDITLRDKVGVSIDVDNIKSLDNAVEKLLTEKEAYKERIKQIVEQHIYHPRKNGEAGGKYIVNLLK